MPTTRIHRWAWEGGGLARQSVRWISIFYRELSRNRAFLHAGALGYGTLIALVPLLLLVFAVLGSAGLLARYDEALEALIFETFLGDLPEVREVLMPGLQRVSLGAVGLVSTAGWLWISARIYLNMESAFSEIFRVPVSRGFAERLLNFYLALTLGPVLVGVGIAGATQVARGLGLVGWSDLLTMPLVIVLVSLAIKLLPCTRVRWLPALVGGTTAGILINVGASAFSLYVQTFAARDPLLVIYGSLGLIPVFLLWLYVLWVFVLLGAQVAYVIQNYGSLVRAQHELLRSEGDRHHHPSLDVALELLASIAWRFQKGRGPIDEAALSEWCHIPGARVGEVLEILKRGGFLVRTGEAWTVGRPPDQVQLPDVVRHWQEETSLRREEGEPVRSPIQQQLEASLTGSLASVLDKWVPPEPAQPEA